MTHKSIILASGGNKNVYRDKILHKGTLNQARRPTKKKNGRKNGWKDTFFFLLSHVPRRRGGKKRRMVHMQCVSNFLRECQLIRYSASGRRLAFLPKRLPRFRLTPGLVDLPLRLLSAVFPSSHRLSWPQHQVVKFSKTTRCFDHRLPGSPCNFLNRYFLYRLHLWEPQTHFISITTTKLAMFQLHDRGLTA